MAYRKAQKEASRFTLRVHNAKTLTFINELIDKRNNRNELLNEILDIGVTILYSRVFGKDVDAEKKKREHSPSVTRELKELRKGVDDLFIALSIVETLVAGLYNAHVAELDGDDVNAESLRDGSLCDLPELVAGIKAELISHKGANVEQ